jgi:putative membrane protein
VSILRSLFPPNPRKTGHEPDYRFSFANERTFLAWIRTALALSVSGLGVIQLLPSFVGRDPLGILLLGLGFMTSATSYRRWAANERAIRTDRPLPASRLPRLLSAGVAIVGLAAAIFLLIDQVL